MIYPRVYAIRWSNKIMSLWLIFIKLTRYDSAKPFSVDLNFSGFFKSDWSLIQSSTALLKYVKFFGICSTVNMAITSYLNGRSLCNEK